MQITRTLRKGPWTLDVYIYIFYLKIDVFFYFYFNLFISNYYSIKFIRKKEDLLYWLISLVRLEVGNKFHLCLGQGTRISVGKGSYHFY